MGKLGKFNNGVWFDIRKINSMSIRKKTFRFVKLELIFIGVLTIYFISMSLLSAASVPPPGLDAIIVLGAGLQGDKVSLTLAQRLDGAAAYARENAETVIVVSGGQGSGESIPEALAMKIYLVQKGIVAERIIMESKSTNTMENFSFSKPILDEYFNKPYTIGYVTNDFHCFRARICAEAAGFENSHAIPQQTLSYLYPKYCAREYFALLWVHRAAVFLITILLAAAALVSYPVPLKKAL